MGSDDVLVLIPEPPNTGEVMIYLILGCFVYPVVAMIVAAVNYEDVGWGDPLDSTLAGLFWLPIAVVFIASFLVAIKSLLLLRMMKKGK